MQDEDIKMRDEVRYAYANGYEDGVKAALRIKQRSMYTYKLGEAYVGALADRLAKRFVQDRLDGRR